jgi:hypothetical protein
MPRCRHRASRASRRIFPINFPDSGPKFCFIRRPSRGRMYSRIHRNLEIFFYPIVFTASTNSLLSCSHVIGLVARLI